MYLLKCIRNYVCILIFVELWLLATVLTSSLLVLCFTSQIVEIPVGFDDDRADSICQGRRWDVIEKQKKLGSGPLV